ncbi:Ngg1p-interacting factor 3 [Fusarium tjaetaba]|uniref:Ngg1p-interacting factor 3 n=1 Tax=Fusarium tjaetaba TaxID=1567544 RepID=A0A8H5S1Y3_9HYPO|nr:Ngg1p-interacting factor 3 [Fusarium tjaetaba]KAF5642652.1 Ngg1p-interacting factor 3 [Fusarium tjaetaba]
MSTIASPRDPPRRTPTNSNRPSFETSRSALASPVLTQGPTQPPGPPQQQQRKTSNRAALREYYNLRASAPRIEIPDSEVPATEIDAPDFNADEYVAKVVEKSSLEELLRLYTRVVGEVRALDAEKKALVYDNYSKLITATETIRKMRANMDPLNPMASTLDPAIAQIYSQASSIRDALRETVPSPDSEEGKKRDAANRQQRTRELAAQVLATPERLRALVSEGKIAQARKEWVMPRKLLESWKEKGFGGSDVEECIEEGDEALRPVDDKSSASSPRISRDERLSRDERRSRDSRVSKDGRSARLPSSTLARPFPLANPKSFCSSCHPTKSPLLKMADNGAWGAWQVESSTFTKAVVAAMQKLYPEEIADKSWDNVGLLVGNSENDAKKKKKVLVTNDLTYQVAVDAIEQDVSVIVSYHPFIFGGLKSITNKDPQQATLLRLAKAGIAVYCPHTAVDAAPEGLNTWLADIVSGPHKSQRSVAIPCSSAPSSHSGAGYGAIGRFDNAVSLSEIILRLAEKLGGLKHVMVASPVGADVKTTKISSFGVCAGSGYDVLKKAEVDLLVTGETSHHSALRAIQQGQTLVQVFHSNSERGYLQEVLRPKLEAAIKENVPEVEVVVSKYDKDPFTILDVNDLK